MDISLTWHLPLYKRSLSHIISDLIYGSGHLFRGDGHAAVIFQHLRCSVRHASDIDADVFGSRGNDSDISVHKSPFLEIAWDLPIRG